MAGEPPPKDGIIMKNKANINLVYVKGASPKSGRGTWKFQPAGARNHIVYENATYKQAVAKLNKEALQVYGDVVYYLLP